MIGHKVACRASHASRSARRATCNVELVTAAKRLLATSHEPLVTSAKRFALRYNPFAMTLTDRSELIGDRPMADGILEARNKMLDAGNCPAIITARSNSLLLASGLYCTLSIFNVERTLVCGSARSSLR